MVSQARGTVRVALRETVPGLGWSQPQAVATVAISRAEQAVNGDDPPPVPSRQEMVLTTTERIAQSAWTLLIALLQPNRQLNGQGRPLSGQWRPLNGQGWLPRHPGRQFRRNRRPFPLRGALLRPAQIRRGTLASTRASGNTTTLLGRSEDGWTSPPTASKTKGGRLAAGVPARGRALLVPLRLLHNGTRHPRPKAPASRGSIRQQKRLHGGLPPPRAQLKPLVVRARVKRSHQVTISTCSLTSTQSQLVLESTSSSRRLGTMACRGTQPPTPNGSPLSSRSFQPSQMAGSVCGTR